MWRVQRCPLLGALNHRNSTYRPGQALPVHPLLPHGFFLMHPHQDTGSEVACSRLVYAYGSGADSKFLCCLPMMDPAHLTGPRLLNFYIL